MTALTLDRRPLVAHERRSPRRHRPGILFAAPFILLAALGPARPASAFCGCLLSASDSWQRAPTSDVAMVVIARDGERTVLTVRMAYEGPPEAVAVILPIPSPVDRSRVRVLDPSLFDALDALSAPRLYDYAERDPCWTPSFPTPEPDVSSPGLFGWSDMAGTLERRTDPEPPSNAMEALFDVEEYEVVVFGAGAVDALEEWLARHGHYVPEGFAAAIEPYAAQGWHFLVARMPAERSELDEGHALLPPLSVSYTSPELTLPLRIGTINSRGSQDVIVQVITPGTRVDVANRPRATIPTHFRVDESVRPRFGAFYDALVEATLERHPGAVVTELAANLGGDGSWDTVLSPDVMRALAGPLMGPPPSLLRRTRALSLRERDVELEGDVGVDEVIRALQSRAREIRLCYEDPGSNGQALELELRLRPPGHASVVSATGDTEALRGCVRAVVSRGDLGAWPGRRGTARVRWRSLRLERPAAEASERGEWTRDTDLVLTRMRHRFASDVDEDLVFAQAPPIEGGYYVWPRRDEGPWILREARPSRRNHFAARYFIGHAYEEAINCGDVAVRGVWLPDSHPRGGPHPYDGLPQRQRELAALRPLRLGDVVREDVPALGLSAAPQPDDPRTAASARPPAASDTASGCGCRTARDQRGLPVVFPLLMSALSFLWSRRRNHDGGMAEERQRNTLRRENPP